MFNIDPAEEHAKHFAKFQAELSLYDSRSFESTNGEMKKFKDYYFFEQEKGERYIHIKQDAPAEVTKILNKLIKTFLTPPFH